MEGEINKVFKQVLKSFLTDNMNSCPSLIKSIEQSKTYMDLRTALENYGEDIAESLGVDIPDEDDCTRCERKDSEIEELNYQLLVHSFTPKTLDDEYKLAAFLRNKDKFSVHDFESLLD